MSSISTDDFLVSVGFVRKLGSFSSSSGGLAYDFGNFELEVAYGVNRWFRQVALLHGVIITPRTIAQVECEMPLMLESHEQGLGFLAWCLDNSSPGSFKPAKYVPWLEEARKCTHLLPWEQDAAVYAARPRCWIQRDWAKLLLRSLALEATIAEDDTPIMFDFDGEVLTIRCADSRIAAAGTGDAWPHKYSIPAQNLRKLPRRLMQNPIEISVWESALLIAHHRYSGVVEV